MPIARRFAAALALWLIAFVAVAADLPRAKPEEVGLSSARLENIRKVLGAKVDAGEIPGYVALVARRGKVAYFEAYGTQNPDTKAPMQRDSIFRVYSMTKPITSVAAMMLVEEGKMKLSDPVSMYLADVFVCAISLAGLPALSLPVGRSEGLPIGAQLIAPSFEEEKLLAAAAALERVVPAEREVR